MSPSSAWDSEAMSVVKCLSLKEARPIEIYFCKIGDLA